MANSVATSDIRTRARDARPSAYDTRHVFLVATLLYFGIFFGGPLLLNTWMSFTEFTPRSFTTWQAPWVGLDNYRTALNDPVFGTALRNTFLISVVTVPTQIIIGIALAVVLQTRFPGHNVFRALLLVPWLIPFIVTGSVWRWILGGRGALNQFLSSIGWQNPPIWLADPSTALGALLAVNIWAGIPFSAIIFFAGLKSIPPELYEAASLDRAGAWQKLRFITLPSLRPLMLLVAVLGMIQTLRTLDLVLILTSGGPANATQTLAYRAFLQTFERYAFGVGSALGSILILITTVFAVAYLAMGRRTD